MNAPEYWWVLSMSAGCIYALLANTEYQHSILERARVLKPYPQWVKLGIYYLSLPMLLALCALVLSDWLTEQSFPTWLLKLEEFGELVGILLSLQAVYFLMHDRVFGAWFLLAASTLTLQLWLYYQALGLDFQTLGQAYAGVLFLVLAAVSFTLHAIDTKFKLAFARPLAVLVLITQWVFSTAEVSANTIIGFDWLSLDTTIVPIGLMALLVLAGYVGQWWWSHSSRPERR